MSPKVVVYIYIIHAYNKYGNIHTYTYLGIQRHKVAATSSPTDGIPSFRMTL